MCYWFVWKLFFFFLHVDPDQISSIVASRMVICLPIVSAMETQPSLRREGRASQVDTLDVSNDILFIHTGTPTQLVLIQEISYFIILAVVQVLHCF